MSLLNERLLLEVEGFEDAENKEELPDDSSLESEDSVDTTEDETSSTDDSDMSDEVVDTPIEEPETIVYRVDYKLGNHDNWSRVQTTSEDEAKETVERYIRQKYPNRDYEFVSVEEFDETELEEDNLIEVTDEELENAGDLDDEFYTNILDEEDMPDDKIFEDLDALDDED
jgi:hypothetical protein